MNNKDLFKAMTEIDEKYIEEAATKVSEVQYESVRVKKTMKTKNKKWLKWAGVGVAAVLVICIGIGALSSIRFGAKSAASYDMAYVNTTSSLTEAPAAAADYKGDFYYESDMAVEESAAYTGEGVYNEYSTYALDTTSLSKKDLKLIYRAGVYVQSTDVAETVSQLKTMLDQAGGYIESSNVENGGYYNNNNYYYAYYTLRVPTENYTAFMNNVGESFYVQSINESVEDVGQQYYEIEARLETLRTKEKRLQELLKEAGDLSDIIELESALSETEYQIDNYTSDLKRYDSLIGYSTINLTIEKVTKPETQINQDDSFGARIARSFRKGWNNFVTGLEDLVLWFTYNLFTLIILAIIFVGGFFLVRSISRKKKAKKAQKDAPEQEQE